MSLKDNKKIESLRLRQNRRQMEYRKDWLSQGLGRYGNDLEVHSQEEEKNELELRKTQD